MIWRKDYMADFTRLNRLRAELEKAKAKRTELDNRIRETERKCKEEESTTIRDIVRAARMTPEQLAALIGMNGAEKLEAINNVGELEALNGTVNAGSENLADENEEDEENKESEDMARDEEDI